MQDRRDWFSWLTSIFISITLIFFLFQCTPENDDSDSDDQENTGPSVPMEKEELPMPPLARAWYYSSAIDSSGNLNLAGFEAKDVGDMNLSDLGFARWTGEAWEEEWIVTDEEFGQVILKLDSKDQPHVVYGYNGDVDYETTRIHYAWKAKGQWQVSEVIFHYRVGSLAFALDENDGVHIGAMLTGADPEEHRVVNIYDEPENWTVEEVDQVKDSTQYLDLKATSDQIHMVYVHTDRDDQNEDSTDNNTVRYGHRQNGQWSITDIDQGEDNGQMPLLMLSQKGALHILYSHSYGIEDQRLNHAVKEDSDWSKDVFDQGAISLMLSAIDGEGVVHGVYEKEIPDYGVMTKRALFYGNTLSGQMEPGLADDTAGVTIYSIGVDQAEGIIVYYTTGPTYPNYKMWRGVIEAY